jgi:hypothetical protein
VAIISLLACSVDAKAGKPPKDIDELLPGSLFGCLALDAIAGRLFVAAKFRRQNLRNDRWLCISITI